MQRGWSSQPRIKPRIRSEQEPREVMRQIPGRALWIGHVGDTRHPRPLLDAGIAAVIELADSEPLATLPRELIRCRFPLSDGGGNPPWLVRLAMESVATLVGAGIPTLVCCGCGMSRSVCVAACGIAIAERCRLEEALTAVAGSGPADVAPGLLVEVQAALVHRATGEPRDDWERTLRKGASDCGVSLPGEALSSEGIYE